MCLCIYTGYQRFSIHCLPLGNVDVLIRRLNSVTKRIQAVLELVHRDILFAALEGPCNRRWTDEHVDSPTLGLEFASLNCNCLKVSNIFKAVFVFILIPKKSRKNNSKLCERLKFRISKLRKNEKKTLMTPFGQH